jgi:glycerol-3-phosphate dehydrogenase
MQGLRDIGAIAAEALGWTEQRLAAEIEDVTAIMSKFHGRRLDGAATHLFSEARTTAGPASG